MKREAIQQIADVLQVTYDDAKNSAILYGEILDYIIKEVRNGRSVSESEICGTIATRTSMTSTTKCWTAFKVAGAINDIVPIILEHAPANFSAKVSFEEGA